MPYSLLIGFSLQLANSLPSLHSSPSPVDSSQGLGHWYLRWKIWLKSSRCQGKVLETLVSVSSPDFCGSLSLYWLNPPPIFSFTQLTVASEEVMSVDQNWWKCLINSDEPLAWDCTAIHHYLYQMWYHKWGWLELIFKSPIHGICA